MWMAHRVSAATLWPRRRPSLMGYFPDRGTKELSKDCRHRETLRLIFRTGGKMSPPQIALHGCSVHSPIVLPITIREHSSSMYINYTPRTSILLSSFLYNLTISSSVVVVSLIKHAAWATARGRRPTDSTNCSA